ncbi:MAG TPA: NIPSNAP family protein [Castellaniella sp.]|uniref:NIPSNAP family protein n=1 Tax=Castellaniella sp. TaxID=1955812 RepID=UPI002EFF834A
MNTLYDVVTLTAKMGKTHDIMEKVHDTPPAPGATLHGIWYSDIGALGRVMVLRSFESGNALMAARQQQLLDGTYYHTEGLIDDVEIGTYAHFPFLPAIEHGSFGAVYEMRTYGIKRGVSLQATIDAWKTAVPERTRLSRLSCAMYALDGKTPRFLNIWPYASLNERSETRAAAVKAGVWPPKGGPAHLTTMESHIYMPAPFSPLK